MIGYFYDKKANIGLILVKFIHIKKNSIHLFSINCMRLLSKMVPNIRLKI